MARLQRPPLPPFSREDAIKKVRMAENAWNTRDPETVSLAYTEDHKHCKQFCELQVAGYALMSGLRVEESRHLLPRA